jgi:hypothetical protein
MKNDARMLAGQAFHVRELVRLIKPNLLRINIIISNQTAGSMAQVPRWNS